MSRTLPYLVFAIVGGILLANLGALVKIFCAAWLLFLSLYVDAGSGLRKSVAVFFVC